jgi:hypothetical protein
MHQNGLAHGHPANHQLYQFTNDPSSTISIVHQYGQINMVMLQTQCKVFCKNTGALFQARARRNNTMMIECIMKTLTPAASVRLLLRESLVLINCDLKY